MGLFSETRFGFGHMVRLWGLVRMFGKALQIEERVIVLGSPSHREGWGKSGEYCNVSREQLGARRWESGYFPLVSPGVFTGEWENNME